MCTAKSRPMLTSQLYLKHIPLQHREIPLRTEDQMVEHLNAYNVPSLPQAPCYIPVLNAWF